MKNNGDFFIDAITIAIVNHFFFDKLHYFQFKQIFRSKSNLQKTGKKNYFYTIEKNPLDFHISQLFLLTRAEQSTKVYKF